jgi:hypothetical protein
MLVESRLHKHKCIKLWVWVWHSPKPQKGASIVSTINCTLELAQPQLQK